MHILLAVVKKEWDSAKPTWTSSDEISRWYLQPTSFPKLRKKLPSSAYEGEEVNFIKGRRKRIRKCCSSGRDNCDDTNNVVIHYVPKNTTTYAGFNWGSIKKAAYADGLKRSQE